MVKAMKGLHAEANFSEYIFSTKTTTFHLNEDRRLSNFTDLERLLYFLYKSGSSVGENKTSLETKYSKQHHNTRFSLNLDSHLLGNNMAKRGSSEECPQLPTTTSPKPQPAIGRISGPFFANATIQKRCGYINEAKISYSRLQNGLRPEKCRSDPTWQLLIPPFR